MTLNKIGTAMTAAGTVAAASLALAAPAHADTILGYRCDPNAVGVSVCAQVNYGPHGWQAYVSASPNGTNNTICIDGVALYLGTSASPTLLRGNSTQYCATGTYLGPIGTSDDPTVYFACSSDKDVWAAVRYHVNGNPQQRFESTHINSCVRES